MEVSISTTTENSVADIFKFVDGQGKSFFFTLLKIFFLFQVTLLTILQRFIIIFLILDEGRC